MQAAAYIWAKVISHLEERSGAATVSAWFDDAEAPELNEQNLILHTTSDFRREIILAKFKPMIDEILQTDLGLQVTLLVCSDAERKSENPKPFWKYNPQFTFDTFVAGPQNVMPLKAATAIAEHLGQSIYNPLWLYGSAGVGKTHLLYAIANRICQLRPDAKIIYTNSDQFTGELIQALRQSSQDTFRSKYQDADILLLDDIQFLAGKDSTQAEVLHAFENLYKLGKQIVLTSDRHPKDLTLLASQLRQRFAEGIVLQIEVPDLETRKQIIRMKAPQLQLSLDEEMVSFLAEKLQRDIRQLEGGLRRIKAFQDLSDLELTMPNIAKIITDLHT